MKRNRRRGARYRAVLLRGAARGLVTAVVLAAGAFAARRAAAWIESHPYFALRKIDVEAHGRLDAKTIVAWAGLTSGMSVWNVRARAGAERLLAHPRIREAAVERRLPDEVRIRVEERRPVVILLASEPLLVAGDGTVFPPLADEPVGGLPYVSGFSGKNVSEPDVGERLRDAVRLAGLWQERGRWPALSEIRPDGEDFLVFASGTPLAVRFPRAAREEDFARLSAVLDLWRGREAEVAAIDLSLPGQAVLKLRRARRLSSRRTAI